MTIEIMNTKYWYKNCPRCKQGRLFVLMRAGHLQPYLHCEECEWTWDDPQDLDPKNGRLGIDYDSNEPILSTLIAFGWKEDSLTATDE